MGSVISQNSTLQGTLFPELNTIYHYCPCEAGLAIVQNGKIRLSDLSTMNDPREQTLGWAPIEELMDSIEYEPGSITEKVVSKTLGWTNAYKAYSKTFAASFTKNRDSLPQWLEYADRGRGFAIGFDRRFFDTPPFRIREVLYNEAGFKSAIRGILMRTREHLNSVADSSDDKIEVACARSAIEILDELHCYKHESWEHENEVRLMAALRNNESIIESYSKISGPNNAPEFDIQFSAKKDRVIPFIEAPAIETSALQIGQAMTHVYIGPKNRTNLETLNTLLHTVGAKNVEVLNSGCEFD